MLYCVRFYAVPASDRRRQPRTRQHVMDTDTFLRTSPTHAYAPAHSAKPILDSSLSIIIISLIWSWWSERKVEALGIEFDPFTRVTRFSLGNSLDSDPKHQRALFPRDYSHKVLSHASSNNVMAQTDPRGGVGGRGRNYDAHSRCISVCNTQHREKEDTMENGRKKVKVKKTSGEKGKREK